MYVFVVMYVYLCLLYIVLGTAEKQFNWTDVVSLNHVKIRSESSLCSPASKFLFHRCTDDSTVYYSMDEGGVAGAWHDVTPSPTPPLPPAVRPGREEAEYAAKRRNQCGQGGGPCQTLWLQEGAGRAGDLPFPTTTSWRWSRYKIRTYLGRYYLELARTQQL